LPCEVIGAGAAIDPVRLPKREKPMELHEALTQISEIRLQMARTEVFRGYHSLPTAFSGLLAIGAALIQPAWVPDPTQQIAGYLTLWTAVAGLSVLAAGLEMWIHCQRSQSALTREVTWLAVEQFLPSAVAGVLLTFVVVSAASESVWLLPGLWQVLFSLGVFASRRLLPRAIFGVAAFYLLAGILTLSLARGTAALAPCAMGVPFGLGQLVAAAVLYWTLERNNVSA
jgi:hypothetical protein